MTDGIGPGFEMSKLIENFGTTIGGVAVAIIGPLLIYFGRSLLRKVKRQGIGLRDAVLWVFMREARRRVTVAVNSVRYCRILMAYDKYAMLIVPGRHDTPVKVDDLFVDLAMEGGGSAAATYSSHTVLDAGSRLLIIGDPGSGKSSLVKMVLRDTCRATMARPHKSRLPILVELRNLKVPNRKQSAEKWGDWAVDELKRQVSQIEGHKMADFFDHCARSEDLGLLLLLDGLDEVISADYARVVLVINALAHKLAKLSPRNTIVLTMRSQFYDRVGREFAEEFPTSLWIQRFSPADIYEFIRRWFVTKRGVAPDALRIYNELADRPSLRDMCSNPLILSMYVNSRRESDSVTLPDTRTEFYQEVVNELLIMRRSKQLSDRDARVAKRRQRETLFGTLSFENMLDVRQSPNSIAWDRAQKVTASVAKTTPAKAKEILDDLEINTGIFSVEREGESIRFIHLTFCEYFAAIEATKGRRDGWESLVDTQRKFQDSGDENLQSRLMEVIPFAIGTLPPSRMDTALSDVLNLGDLELYGRCLLETQEYDHEGWQKYATGEYQYFTDESDWDESWLRRLHLYQTVVADARMVSERMQVALTPEISMHDLFVALVADDRARLTQLFSSYAGQDPVAAIRLAEACNVDLVADTPELLVTACETPAFLAFAMESAATSEARVERWAQIFVEAALRKTLVAKTLAEAAPNAVLRDAVARIEPRRRWMVTPGTRAGSFYDACLTIAANRRSPNIGDFWWRSAALRATKPPAEVRREVTVRAIVSYPALVAATVLYFRGFSNLSNGNDDAWGFAFALGTIVIFFATFFLTIFHALAPLLATPVIEQLVNLRTSPRFIGGISISRRSRLKVSYLVARGIQYGTPLPKS
ncbi:NACHT domain-containing protein [Actinoplanes sp. CA-142083]|uniref:NACHT domain-containing protein n=1 Tax=Actinoplanes sp. CA-142083 TaxID=3239903 RepID=UPI003D927BBA